MAMSGVHSGIHQLSPNCYPPSDSDDEDSFVVLSNSLGPDNVRDSVISTEPISANIIQLSLDSVVSALSTQNVSHHSNSLKHEVDGDLVSQFASTIITPEDIQKKVDDLIAENTKLKDTLAQNNMAMKAQVDTLAEWQEKVLKVQESHREKFAEMKKYIDVLKGENAILKNAAAAASRNNSVSEESKLSTSQILTAKSIGQVNKFELEAAQKKIEELQKALDLMCLEKEKQDKINASNLNEQFCKIEELKRDNAKLMDEKQKIADDFEEEKEKAGAATSKLESEIQDLRNTNTTLMANMKILEDHQATKHLQLLEEIANLEEANKEMESREKDFETTRHQLMSSQMHITELKQQHGNQLLEKDERIRKLQMQVKKLKIVDDEVMALRTQADLYKADYEMENKSKNEILEEKKKVSDDLHHLQRRNQQLLEEVEQLRGDFIHVSKEEASGLDIYKFACPICNFKFKDPQSLDNHMDRCINLDALP